MKTLSIRRSLLILAALAPASLHATVLLSDTFADGDRTNANLPSSSAWFLVGGGTPTSAVTGGSLVTQSSSTAFTLTAAFAGASGYTLSAGQTIRLTFSLTASFNGNSSADAFRFGIFNSNGSRITADGSGGNGADPAFNGWQGYSYWSPQGTTDSNAAIRERTSNNNTLFAAGANANRSSTPYAAGNFVSGTTYQGTFAISYDGTTTTVVAGLGPSTHTWTTGSPSTLTFDSISFFVAGSALGADGSLALDDVSVELVPEPAAILLTALSSLVFLRRKRCA